MSYIPRLKKEYKETITNRIMESHGLVNIMQVPKLKKIVISKGVGAAVADKKIIDHAVEELTLISGQKAVATKSKKDISAFKLRKGMPIGAKVTLRGDRMYEFLQRLLSIAIPRERDFRGLDTKSFDGRGNYSMGIKEHIIFPEIDYDKVDKIRGMDVCISTSASDDESGEELLRALKFPFKN